MIKRTRLALAVGVTVLAAALLWWPRQRRPTTKALAPAQVLEEGVAREDEHSAAPATSPSAPHIAVGLGKLIGEVELEKSTVCPFEDFRVSVRPAVDDSRAQFNIDGKFGTDFILKASPAEEEQVHWVVATDRRHQRDYRQIKVRVLPDTDARCQSVTLAEIEQTDDASTPDGKRFEVTPVHGLGRIKSVEWSFGDGDVQTTQGARVVHGYGRRPQETETVGFVVSAFATDVGGRHAQARTGVSFKNTHFQARMYTGDRPEPVEYNPFLFGGGGTVPVRVTNVDSRPVEFRHAVVTVQDCAGGEPHREELSAADFVRGGPLGAGETNELAMDMSSRWFTGACRLGVELDGDTIPPSTGTRDGGEGPRLRPVTAKFNFVLRRPLSAEEGGPAEGASEPIRDPELQAKLQVLMQQRKTGYVTQTDLDDATSGKPSE